jgi:hypothetical protein
VGVFALALLVSILVPGGSRISARGNLTKAILNCKQVVLALRNYSADHNGNYPDAELDAPRSSNEVFRILFRQEAIDHELIFGCPVSSFMPDGNLGKAPGVEMAVQAGENHWAMTRGLTDNSPAAIPLVYENPAKATWPPVWNADAKGTNARGRAWSNSVIIGLNDSSVSIQPLESQTGTAVPLKKQDGKDLFEAAINPATFPWGEVLDVEEAP